MMNNKGNKEKTMSWWTVWKGIDFFFSCKIITVTGQLFPLLLIFANVKRWMQSICYISGMIKKSFFLIGCLDQFLSEFDTILLPLSFSELVQHFESLLCVYRIIRLKHYQQSRQPSMRKSALKEIGLSLETTAHTALPPKWWALGTAHDDTGHRCSV